VVGVERKKGDTGMGQGLQRTIAQSTPTAKVEEIGESEGKPSFWEEANRTKREGIH